MTAYVEEKYMKCNACNKVTLHKRNNTKMELGGFLVHLILVFMTMGVWLLFLLLGGVLKTKIGGWICAEC